jgi:hypothetical protein
VPPPPFFFSVQSHLLDTMLHKVTPCLAHPLHLFTSYQSSDVAATIASETGATLTITEVPFPSDIHDRLVVITVGLCNSPSCTHHTQ